MASPVAKKETVVKSQFKNVLGRTIWFNGIVIAPNVTVLIDPVDYAELITKGYLASVNALEI